MAYHFHEPLGVVAQIIPWNFPLLMAVWKLAPALAAGNCVVLKPAEQTPMSIAVLMDMIADILPPGVINVVQGFGVEAGKPLAQSKRVAKVAFTGETTTGRLIMQYASENIIPVTLELGGKSPNIFFKDVMAEDDDFLDKALEGFTMFALNQGEVCTCPSRALVHEAIYDRFMERAIERVGKIVQGNPLDMGTMVGAQASNDQLEKILSYFDIGRQEGARALIGGERAQLGGDRRRHDADLVSAALAQFARRWNAREAVGQALHAPAFLVDEDQCRLIAGSLAKRLDEGADLVGGVDVAGEQDEAPGLHVAEEGALFRRDRLAGAAQDAGGAQCD